MRAPEILAERFELLEESRSGGMGTLYRARDRHTGVDVALKVLHDRANVERFAAEAQMLAELDDPTIVRYVAHGTLNTASRREHYLAMEWLDGVDLQERLERGGPLREASALTVAARVARALSVAHARGIVHRDIKPSNVFLPGGAIEAAKVLDFGIARWDCASRARTRTGAVVGTPAYMAPEQARAERTVDSSVDVFALGCVLFECLTGLPAFAGETAMAVLAKILFEPAPRLRQVLPDAHDALDALVTSMLEKDPQRRPRDGTRLGEAIADCIEAVKRGRPLSRPPTDEPVTVRTAGTHGTLGTRERRMAIFVIAQERDARAAQAALATGPTLDEIAFDGVLRTIDDHEGRAERLADGSVVALFETMPHGEPVDAASMGARCALELRRLVGERSIALAVAPIETGVVGALGRAIDHAAQLLASDAALRAVAVDSVAAGLLDARFDIRVTENARELVAEKIATAGVRTLLGRPTPCVGRDRELAALEAIVDEAMEERRSRAALVTAAAGIGKTRVALELVRRVRTKGLADVWIVRGDPTRAGAALGLLVPLVRRMAGIGDGESMEMQTAKLSAHVAAVVPDRESAPRIAAFLCELVGAAGSDDSVLPAVAAARKNPRVLAMQLRRALAEWLAAQCERRPQLVVIDDLHWGDLSSIEFLDAVLRELSAAPLAVLAFGRAEVDELFPRLWASADAQHVRLGTLGKKTGETLARHVLGDNVPSETLARIVELSGGNAFFLEELIRAVAENALGTLPETVIAMTSARLERLPLTARRLLRAGSIFGDAFWRGAVASLVDGQPTLSIDDTLESLVRAEVITLRDEARFAGEIEYVFRHALVRDAAYAMLTEEDRILGHRLAGEWLAARGEDRAAVLAEHFARGEHGSRARTYYVQAAAQSLAATDFRNTIAYSDRAVALGAAEREFVEAKTHRARACIALGSWADARAAYVEVLEALGPDGDSHERAQILVALASTAFFDFDMEAMDRQASAALDLVAGDDAPEVEAQAIACLGLVAQARGDLQKAKSALAKATARADGGYVPGAGPLLLATFWSGHFDEAIERSRRFLELAREAGDVAALLVVMPQLGLALAAEGRYVEAERTFADAVELGKKHGSNMLARVVSMSTGMHLDVGHLDEARRRAERAFDLATEASFPPSRVSAMLDLGAVYVRSGDLSRIDGHLAEIEKLLGGPANQGWHEWLFAPRLVLLRAERELARGEAKQALVFADDALARVRRVGRPKLLALSLRMRGVALHRAGQRDAAHASISDAHRIASELGDPALCLSVTNALLEIAPDEELDAQARAFTDRIAAEFP